VLRLPISALPSISGVKAPLPDFVTIEMTPAWALAP